MYDGGGLEQVVLRRDLTEGILFFKPGVKSAGEGGGSAKLVDWQCRDASIVLWAIEAASFCTRRSPVYSALDSHHQRSKDREGQSAMALSNIHDISHGMESRNSILDDTQINIQPFWLIPNAAKSYSNILLKCSC